MVRISFLTTNNSSVENHTSLDKFLWYSHYKHLRQRSEKLALKHHSSLQISMPFTFINICQTHQFLPVAQLEKIV